MIQSGQRVPDHVALQRTRDTMTYFTGGLALTSIMTGLMLRSPKMLMYSSSMGSLFFILPSNIFLLYKMYSTPNTKENSTTKHLYWLGFNAVMSFSLLTIIYAMNSRDDAFLGMGGVLGAGLGAITMIGIANLFLQSHALYNIWIWAGLGLFTAYTLYDMKVIMAKAKASTYFDPISQSVSVYLDFINIFIRILAIMNNKKNKK